MRARRLTRREPDAPSLAGRRFAPAGFLLALLASCSGPQEPAPPPDDLAYACEDGRIVRFLEERDWNRAVLTTTTERITLLRAQDDTGGERYVTRTGWEFRMKGDDALLTSPGREQTRCRYRGSPWS